MTNFFQDRMMRIGATTQNNVIHITNPDAEFPAPRTYSAPIFSEDAEGNINILYYTLDKRLVNYTQYGSGKSGLINAKLKNYIVTRLKEPKGDMKYKFPSSENTDLKTAESRTFPFFPPALCEKYERKENIKNLLLTEGVFKAFAASTLCGFDIIGLSSITHYANAKGQLHHDIAQLVHTCKVENVTILWDGDCLDISQKALQNRDALTNRVYGFFSAAKNIRKLLKDIPMPKGVDAPRIFFAHVKSEVLPEKPKGIDDLLELLSDEKKQAVFNELNTRIESVKDCYYFEKIFIDNSTDILYKHFALQNAEVFYNRHREKIGETEFFFFHDQYKYSDEQNKLICLAPGWAKNVQFIGDEFFEENNVPGANTTRRVLIPRKETTLKKLYGADFFKFVREKHCVSFCNVPSHFKYESIVELDGKKFYNRYFPFQHVPAEGNCKTSLDFVKHIFGTDKVPYGEKTLEMWELGLDYIQLLLTKPTQVLPVVCFYSPENNTGKSTFTNWLIKIFGDNAIQIGNADLQSDFNEQFADKLLAVCEETLLERKKDAERIKAMSTAKQISVNPKGSAQYTIDFFCKFIFNSNNKRMIYVTRHDERFWIIQVNRFRGTDNPQLPAELATEIPQFINFLANRKMATKQESRMWFAPKLLKTKAFEEAVMVNEPNEASNLRQGITDMFLQDEGLNHIEMTFGDIKDAWFAKNASNRWVNEVLSDYIKTVDLERDKNGVAINRRGEFTKWVTQVRRDENGRDIGTEVVPIRIATRGRHYIFHRKDFVTANDAVFREFKSKDTEDFLDALASPNDTSWNTAAANDNETLASNLVNNFTDVAPF